MNKSLLRCLVCILISITPFSIYSMEESPSYPIFYELDFQKENVGFILENGDRPRVPSAALEMVYGIFSNKKIEILTVKTFKEKFPKAKMTNEDPVNYYGDSIVTTQNGTGYKVKYSACTKTGETDDVCRKLAITVDKKLINIDLKLSKICDGCRIIAVERWGNNLWMSFAFRNEYEPDGHGVHVLDIKKGKVIGSVKKRSDLFTVIKKDPANEIMWVAGSSGLYGYDSKINCTSH